MHRSFSTAARRISSRTGLLIAAFTLWTLASTFTARAGDNSWSAIGPDGGGVATVVFHRTSQNVLYARAAGGFYHSTDGGSHWQQSQAEITSYAADFAVDPTNNDRIYLVISQLPSRVLLSTDAGVSFSTLATLPDTASTPSFIAISADGNTLYAVCNQDVFRSTDSGRSWEQRTSAGSDPLAGERALVDPSDANTVYFLRNARLLVTRDGASTWTDMTPAGSTGVQDFVIDPADSNSLWAATTQGLSHSPDRGASWTVERSGFAPAVGLDPQSPTTVYVAESDGSVFRRNGTTWSEITSDLGSFWPHLIVVSPYNSDQVVVANPRGLWMTTNGGSGWTRSDAGLASSTISGFAILGNRTYTKGNALTRLDHGSDTPVDIETRGLFQVLHSRSSHLTAVAPLPDSAGGLIVGVINRIGRTLDDGATWNSTAYATTVDDRIVDLVATTTVPSVYYASSELTLQRSTDQGFSWSEIVTGLPAGQSPGLIAIAPSNQSVLYAGPRSPNQPGLVGVGVYKSINGGDSWTPANTGIEDKEVTAIAVHPTNPDIVYVGAIYNLMKTVDGGATWTQLPWTTKSAVRVHAIAIDPRAPDTIYVAGDALFNNEVARSTDGGTSWTALAAPTKFFPWAPSGLAIDTTRQDTLRVGTERGGIRQMTIRPDLLADLAIELTPRAIEIPLLVPTEYNFTIRNLGPASSSVVNTTIQLSGAVTAVTATPSVGTCTVVVSTINCTAPSLNANATISIVLSVTPATVAAIDIVGSVSTDGLDGQLSNNTARHITTVTNQADLAMTIVGPATAQTGAPLQYIATVTNSGPSTATSVRASFALSGITQMTFSVTAGTCINTGSNGIQCEIGSLPAGASVTLTVNGTAAPAGVYLATGTVTGEGTDNTTTDNSAQMPTNITSQPAPQPNPPTPQPPGGGGNSNGGGGGGGGVSPLMLIGLLAMLRARRKPSPRLGRGTSW